MYSQDEKAIVWLDSFAGLNREKKLKIIREAKTPSAILSDVSVIKRCIGKELDEGFYSLIKNSIELGMPDKFVKQLDEKGITAVTCMSDDYPDRFLEIPDPPLVIYCKGNISLLKKKQTFSIVGSRKTMPAILEKVQTLSNQLSFYDVVLVTGLAEGVDSAVIKGSVEKGNIISVLPSGFDKLYPEYNRSLFDEVVEKGLVISEYKPEVNCLTYHFPERNRLIAALGKGLLVASAGKKSGTSYTADYANSYGKTVFAFPYTPGIPSGEGCNAMIKEFALLCDCTEDIYFYLGINTKPKKEKSDLSKEEKTVFNCIKDGDVHIDLLLQETGMKISEITPILTMLEIKKYIAKNPGNIYSAIK